MEIFSKNNINNTVIIQDKTKNTTSTSLEFPGDKYIGWGKLVNQNFYWLLENFAGNVSPDNPVTGQLWYDTNENTLKVYDGSNWNNFSGRATVTTTLPTSGKEGDIVFIKTSEEKAIYFYDGTTWVSLLKIRSSTTPPASPSDGDIWHDTSNNEVKIYFAGNFIKISNDTSSSTQVNVSNFTTNDGKEIYVIKMANNIVAAFSYTTVTAGNLGILDGIDLSTVFTAGLKPGLNFSMLGKNIFFNSSSEILFENSSTGNIKVRIDNKDMLTLDKINNKSFINSDTEINGTLDINSSTYLKIPTGDTNSRPSSPLAGMMRFNTDSGKIEFHNGTDWKEIIINFEIKSSEVSPLSANPFIPGWGVITHPHGEASIPKMFFAYAKCIVSAGGYVPGDEILLAHQTDADEASGPSQDYFSTWADSTHIGFASRGTVRIMQKNGIWPLSITGSPNFRLIFKWIP